MKQFEGMSGAVHGSTVTKSIHGRLDVLLHMGSTTNKIMGKARQRVQLHNQQLRHILHPGGCECVHVVYVPAAAGGGAAASCCCSPQA
jgi:hypothetical protein